LGLTTYKNGGLKEQRRSDIWEELNQSIRSCILSNHGR
jgi:hypothetical protein